jgi:H+/gluconate symporter-like permease
MEVRLVSFSVCASHSCCCNEQIFVESNQRWYPNGFDFAAVGLADYTVDVAKTGAIWAVGLALIVGIIAAILFDYGRVVTNFKEGINASIGGSLLAVMNTASGMVSVQLLRHYRVLL